MSEEITHLNRAIIDPWIKVTDRLPEEAGRYWCYVAEQGDLGLSHFQWNCCYHSNTKTFTDSTFKGGEQVTHWTHLLPPPPKQP